MSKQRDYANGKIYCIKSPYTEQVYIGSTVMNKLSQRMANHRSSYQYYLNSGKGYTTSFEIIKKGDAYIELIESYPCNNVYELQKKEGFYIKTTLNRINKVIAGRTYKEYRIDNYDKIKERDKHYRDTHPEYIKQKNTNYYKNNIEEEKKRKLQYYHDHKEELTKKNIEYNKKNKERIKERVSEKITCECGETVSRKCMLRHTKRQIHLDNMIKLGKEVTKEQRENIKPNPKCDEKTKEKNRIRNSQQIMCECGDTVSRQCLTKHKSRSKHINKMNELNNPQNNERKEKDEINNEEQKEKDEIKLNNNNPIIDKPKKIKNEDIEIYCDVCNLTVLKKSIYGHRKSKRHINKLKDSK